MNPTPQPSFSARWLPVMASVLFAVSHTQPPLYYSNQNQYFLHAAARAGVGDLSSDWLANTTDPTIAFTVMMQFLLQTGGEWSIQAAFFGLLMIYFGSLWAIVVKLPFAPVTTAGRWLLAALTIGIHAGVTRAASVALCGVDYPWYFQAGVANQYLLGAGIQPSVFGVFLLSALACYINRRLTLAAMCIDVACLFHSIYLLPGALLTIALMYEIVKSNGVRSASKFAAIALVGVVPTLFHIGTQFRPTDGAMFAESQRILAWIRIPHHCDVARWLDWVAVLQLAWAMFGIVAMRRTSLFIPLVLATVLAILFSVTQILTSNATLALLFPWRISAVLVPIATIVLFTQLVSLAEQYSNHKLIAILAIVLLTISVVGAGIVSNYHLAYQTSVAEDGLQSFVAVDRQPGDVYLLPASFPKPPAKAGSASSSFVPVPQTGRPAVFELQRFRLITGAATFVDFKSIPYRDVEVLEWHRRVSACVRWYGTSDWDVTTTLAEVRAEGVTHVVVPDGVVLRSAHLREVYRDSAYRVYQIR